MKKFFAAALTAFLFLLTFSVHAQSKTGADFFEGKWNVVVKGTPEGDVKMVFVLTKSDSTLSGVVQDTAGGEISKMDKVEVAEKSVTVYFSARGYDLSIPLTPKDDDRLTGSLMGMFEVEADRVKPVAKLNAK